MMITEYDDLSEESDKVLVRAFVDVATQLRRAYWEWIQEEIKRLAIVADSLEPTLEGVVKAGMQETSQRIRDIDRHELPEAIRSLKEKISEIDGGAWKDAPDARRYLEEGLSRLEALVRELLHIRDSLESLLESSAGSER